MWNDAWVRNKRISQVKLKLHGCSQAGEFRSHFARLSKLWGEALRNYANDGDVFLFVMQSFVVPIWTILSHLQLRQFFIFAAYEPWVYSKKMATCLVFPTCYWILCPHRTSGCVDTAITMRLLVFGDRLCHLRHRLDMWAQGALP